MMHLLLARRLSTALAVAALMSGTASLGYSQGKLLLYVPDRFNNQVSDFDITGGGTALIGSAPETTPFEVAITPNGKFAYVATSTTVDGYKIDSSGSATAVPPGAITPVGIISGLATDPTSHYLYVSNTSARDLETYSIDQTTGVLTQAAPPITFAVNTILRGLAADASNHLYLAVQNTVPLPSTVGYTIAYQIGPTGSLTQIGSPSPTATAFGGGPLRLAIGGSILFGTVPTDGQVALYQIQAGGGLSPLGASNVITVNGGTSRPTGIAVSGNTMVLTDAGGATNNVRSYSFTQAATYSLVGTATAASTFALSGIAADSAFAYVSVSGGIARFSLDPATAIMSATPVSTIPLPAGANPQFLAVQAAPAASGGGSGPSAVPAASTWALALLGILLAASSVIMCRRAYR